MILLTVEDFVFFNMKTFILFLYTIAFEIVPALIPFRVRFLSLYFDVLSVISAVFLWSFSSVTPPFGCEIVSLLLYFLFLTQLSKSAAILLYVLILIFYLRSSFSFFFSFSFLFRSYATLPWLKFLISLDVSSLFFPEYIELERSYCRIFTYLHIFAKFTGFDSLPTQFIYRVGRDSNPMNLANEITSFILPFFNSIVNSLPEVLLLYITSLNSIWRFHTSLTNGNCSPHNLWRSFND